MRPRIHAAPLALAADATILMNVAHLHRSEDPGELLLLALRLSGEVFIGVVLTRRETREVVAWLKTSAAEVVGHVGGDRLRSKRRAR